MTTTLMFVHCLSPLHAGTGQSIGAVDLPIAREVTTGLPYLPGSSIKGTLRDRSRQVFADTPEHTTTIFGPDTANASDHAGALTFSDAALLLLPVRSVCGTFAYATSPLLLQRFLRDVREASNVTIEADIDALDPGALTSCRVTPESVNRSTSESNQDKVLLEDMDLSVTECEATQAVAEAIAANLFERADERALFVKRFVIVHDDVMAYLSRHAIDVVTRSSLNPETKTVKQGQLWTEENLPTESVLCALVLENGHLAQTDAGSVSEHLPALVKGSVQFGGHATIGRGRCRVVIPGGER